MLIDGDVLQPSLLGKIMAEASKHGKIVVREAYGNASKMDPWENCFRCHRINVVPNQVDGNNSTDHTLMMAAAELLCSRRKIDVICIVAGDKDFSNLANWIRRRGVFVIGIGNPNASSDVFKAACDEFKHDECLPEAANPDPVAAKNLSKWKKAAMKSVRKHAGKDGWSKLNMVHKGIIDINPRDYCSCKLLHLFKSCREFQIKDPDFVRIRVADA